MDLSKKLEESQKEYRTSDWITLVEGNNKVRIMVEPEAYGEHYSKSGYKGICVGKAKDCLGCKEGTTVSVKWLSWAIPRADDGFSEDIKLIKIPNQAFKKIAGMQKLPDWKFDKFPMPYDVTIIKTVKNDKTEYDLIAARKEEPVSEALMTELLRKTPVSTIIQSMKDKKLGIKRETGEKVDYPESGMDGQPDPEKIPF